MASYDSVLGYGKDTAEAYMKSATVAGKGIETLGNEMVSYSKGAIEESIAASKAIMGSKSVHEAFELQTDFAKTAFEAYVEELTKFNSLVTATAKDAFAPLQGRVSSLGRSGSKRPRRLILLDANINKRPGAMLRAFSFNFGPIYPLFSRAPCVRMDEATDIRCGYEGHRPAIMGTARARTALAPVLSPKPAPKPRSPASIRCCC